MKFAWAACLLLVLAACSQPTPNGRDVIVGQAPPVSHRGELVNGGPKVLLDGSAGDVRVVRDLASIAGNYYTQSGNTVEISTQGLVKASGGPWTQGQVELDDQGARVAWKGGEPVRLQRIWLGLEIGEDTLLRVDGRIMFELPRDERLVGRFQAEDGQILFSGDGRVFDHVATHGSIRSVKRFLHSGVYGAQEGKSQVWLRYLDPVDAPEDLLVVFQPEGGVRIGGVVFQSVSEAAPTTDGSYQDANGNRLAIAADGGASFKLTFPGKAHAIEATGRVMTVGENLLRVESEEVGPAFSFVLRKLAMGHVMATLPASYGSTPLLLMAPINRRVNPPTSALMGLYLNPDGYDMTLAEGDKISVARKSIKGGEGTPGAIERQVIGVELYDQGVAKVHYDQGTPLLALFEETGKDQLSFYPTDYKNHVLYQSDLGDAHRMTLTRPQDGLGHKEVPTLTLGETALRHYLTAYPDFVADAFEAEQRKKDLLLAEKHQNDEKVQLSADEAQAERERRMRRREDGRNSGDPTPDVGEFFVSKHQARVNEMLDLRRQLAALATPRNAAELRANMAKEKKIRARAAELEQLEATDTGAP